MSSIIHLKKNLKKTLKENARILITILSHLHHTNKIFLDSFFTFKDVCQDFIYIMADPLHRWCFLYKRYIIKPLERNISLYIQLSTRVHRATQAYPTFIAALTSVMLF